MFDTIAAKPRIVACGVPALCLIGSAISLLFGAAGAQGSEARRLTTSSDCRSSLDAMLRDANWLYVNNTVTRWCRIKLESKMADCCQLEDFNRGYAEGCSGCTADCTNQLMIDLCNKWFGKGCSVSRHPFLSTGAPGVQVMETFCVPAACTNNADLLALMPWYDSIYRSRRAGWFANYDDAALTCPSNAAIIIVIVVACVLGIVLMIPLGFILFSAPKERGRTLISQADMQAAEEEDEAR